MIRRMLIAVVVGASLAATAAAAAPPEFAAMQVDAYEPPKPAPTFELPSLAGRPERLAEFRGKVLMLFFWTTW